MAQLGKTSALQIRLNHEQRRRIRRAARLVSLQKGEIVRPSSLFREVGMRGIEQLLETAAPEPAE